jgi:hypothetical protein
MAPSTPFKFGNTTILIEHEDFADGYDNGYAHYPTENELLTVEAIHRLIVENLSDQAESPIWNTGYILGALTGIYVGRSHGDEPHAPKVQLGPVTLHLNRWRFRDGYYIGQEHYRLCQTASPTPTTITARELLDLIAHRDPATQTYYFGQDELAALEDILGRLVGYLCAAFSASMAHESVTEPLPNPALQATS